MAQTKRKSEFEGNLQPAIAAPGDRGMAAESPARALQQLLEQRTVLSQDVARWSRRRSLAFIVAASTSLWLAILVAVHGAALVTA